MSNNSESDHCPRSDRPIKSSDPDFTPATPNKNLQDLPNLGSQFSRIEASFKAIATQHQLRYRRLLALNWAAKYHGIPAGTFRKAFEMWLQSHSEGGEI